MNSTWNYTDTNEGVLTIDIDGDVWKSACDYIWKQEADALELPNFKRVPVIVAKKHIDSNIIYEKAILETMDKVYAQALIRHHLYVIDEPSYSNELLSEEKAIIHIYLKVASKPILGKYIGLPCVKINIEVSEEEIQQELSRIQRKNTYYLDKEGTVEIGNQVTLDYTGMIDGKLIENGSASDFVLSIGSHTFMDDFENQLIGMQCKEEKKINVTFPLSYPDAKLAGQQAVFYIYLKDIQRKVEPAIDDTLANDEGYESLEDFIEYIIEEKKAQKESIQLQENTEAILDMIIQSSILDIHPRMIEDDLDAIISQLEQNLRKQNFTLESYCQMTNTTIEELRNGFKEQSIKRIQTRLVLDAIMEKEHIEPTDEEINHAYEYYAREYNMGIDYIKQFISEDTVRYDLSCEKTMQFIMDHTV